MTKEELMKRDDVNEAVKQKVLDIAHILKEKYKTPLEVGIKNTLHAYIYPRKIY